MSSVEVVGRWVYAVAVGAGLVVGTAAGAGIVWALDRVHRALPWSEPILWEGCDE